MDRYQVLYYEDEKGFSPIEMFFAIKYKEEFIKRGKYHENV